MNNTEIVKKAYECFGKGDIEGLMELYSDDVSWEIPKIDNAAYSGARRGKEAVSEFFELLAKSETFTQFEPVEFIAEGDKVVVLGKSEANITATGKSFSTEWVHISTVMDGKITGFKEFFDTAAANQAHQLHAVA
ncbi:MAG: nuclear transport factor 2 family protein [bacterium]|nr:nuclear transport factor 2 family protein [bacterium]